MGKIIAELEARGRIVIPKSIRRELNMEPGQKLLIQKCNHDIILKKARNFEDLSKLRGCIERSIIDELDVKKIWK
jgi:AbrB family looped-hinge helix DNA binding protein